MCFCVLLYFTACMLYYWNTVGWAWWDWGLIWWLTIFLQCFDTVGWVTWPVKISSPNDLYCVEWDVKPYSTQLPSTCNPLLCSNLLCLSCAVVRSMTESKVVLLNEVCSSFAVFLCELSVRYTEPREVKNCQISLSLHSIYLHCVPRKRPPFYFSNNSGQKLTEFNYFWCGKSWENLISNSLYICPPHLYTAATLPCEIQKSFFKSIIHTHFRLFTLSHKKTNCYPLTVSFLLR